MVFPKSLLEKISHAFCLRRESVALAESVTSGFLQFAFSQMDKASLFFGGGVTVYTLKEKVRILGVNGTLAEKVNCVSLELSESMARNAAQLFESAWGIAITGFATPVPESRGELFAYYAIAYEGRILSSGCLESSKLLNQEETQYLYSIGVLESLSTLL